MSSTKRCFALACAILVCTSVAFAQIESGWTRVSGLSPCPSSPGADGLGCDRENSYAWAMDVLGDHLYVGTSRNVFWSMLSIMHVPPPPAVPTATDPRGRIFRMNTRTDQWEQFYLQAPAPGAPVDAGYRMMRTYTPPSGTPTLYVGSMGFGGAKLYAITQSGELHFVHLAAADPSRLVSVRAIASHQGELFWAADRAGRPIIFHAPDPLASKIVGNSSFEELTIPAAWLPNNGEVLDMISYNGQLYVFLLPHDPANSGFWCGKAKKRGSKWEWELIVGDQSMGAKYPAGMGAPNNGGAVPIRYKDSIYVGTLDGAAFRMMNGVMPPMGSGPMNPINMMGGLVGMQLFRFNQRDDWERLMPHQSITNPALVAAENGFGNPFNKYLWRFGIIQNRLYVGTFDIQTGLMVLGGGGMPASGPPANPMGFDLYWTEDGDTWTPASINGFNDPMNYGVRSFATDPRTGTLYLGTANPFFGCQVWKRNKAR